MSSQDGFTDGQALSILLAIEAFMLAIVNLTATLSAPGRRGVAKFAVKPENMAIAAAVTIALVALGALAAWCGLFVGDTLRPAREIAIAAALLVAIVAQPVFAALVARALRSAE